MSNETGSWASYQKLVLKLLEQHDEKLEQLSKQLNESDTDRARIHISILALKEDMELLKGVIRESSAISAPFATRLDRLEIRVNDLLKLEGNKQKESNETRNYRRGIIAAIVGSSLSIIWSIIEVFLR
jgi:septal ring factor EnvC (AmiA/AmiB activator)